MYQAAFRTELATYLARNPQTENGAVLQALIDGDGDLFARGDSLAHVTASAWILNEDWSEALLIEHAKYRKFCPPGGHVDAGELPIDACFREAGEEVGLHKLARVLNGIFDIDIHRIPASEKKNEPAHWHIDVRYALQACSDERVKLNLDECLSYRWQPIVELAKLDDPSIVRLATKTLNRSTQSLVDLGYSEAQIACLHGAMSRPTGLVLVAGTSSSEPDVTLQGILRDIDEAKRAKLLGELRDNAKIEHASSLVLSGNQVLSSIHASCAFHIPIRLRACGMNPDLFSSEGFLAALIYQVKLPRVCQTCAISYEEAKEKLSGDVFYQGLMERLPRLGKADQHHNLKFRNESGCKCCTRGIIGFTRAAEVVEPDAFMRECFKDGRDRDALHHYRKSGGKIAIEHALEKAFQGEVDLRDVEARLDQLCLLAELAEEASR